MESNKYPKTMEAAGVHALVVDEEKGSYFSIPMIESLEKFATKAEQTESALTSKVQENTQLNATIEQLKADHAKAVAELTAAHSTEIATLKADHKTALDEVTGNLKNAQELIVAKDAEIKELSEATPAAPAPEGGKPQDNNTGGQQEQGYKVESISKPGMTTAQKQEAWKKRMAELEQKRFGA